MGKGKKNKAEKQEQGDFNGEGPAHELPNLVTPKPFYKFVASKVHPEIDKNVEQLVKYINKNLKVWEQHHNFVFLLPDSQFDLTRQTPVIKYLDQEKIVDDVEPRPLSQSQQQSLYETGTFIVNSKKYSIPYKWLVHSMLYVGIQDRRETYLRILSAAFGQIYKMKENLFGEKHYSFKYVANALKNVALELVDLFIGRPFCHKTFTKQPARVLEIQRQVNLKKDWDNDVQKSLNYLYQNEFVLTDPKEKLDSQEAIREISRIEAEFNTKWNEISGIIRDKIEQEYEDGEVQERLEEEKYKLLYSIESNLRPELLQHLHFLLREQEIIKMAFRKLKSDNIKSRIEIENELKSHEVKSRFGEWYQTQLAARIPKVQTANYYATLDWLQTQLQSPFFKDYVLFCKNYSALQEIAKDKLSIQSAMRTYTQSYKMAFSKVIETPSVPPTYTLKTHDSFSFSTDHYFWRFQTTKGVFILITNELINQCIHNIRRGPISVQYLFGREKYYYGEIVDYYSGEKKCPKFEHMSYKPLIMDVKESVEVIRKNREEFESSPDTGFMKKSYLRVFNLVYCYLFLGLIKLGLFLCLIKPVLCVIGIAVSAFGLAFFWFVAISTCIMEYLFGVLIYRHRIGDYDHTNHVAFPLAYSLLKIVGNIIKAVWIVLLIIFFHPLFSLIIALFALLYRAVTTVYYGIVFSIIKVIARSPTSDSKIAWRIAGPGISKNFSQKINPDDIYILFLSECEKIHLNLYQQRISGKLNQIIYDNNSLIHPLIQSFQLTSNSYHKLQQSINFYINRLKQQIAQRMRIYPKLHNSVVRFTQEQLNQYTGNCIEMVQYFMVSHDNCDFYQYFSIDKNNRDKDDLLVIAIWKQIFGNGSVFEAYASADERYCVIEDDRDMSETINVMSQINTQHKFRKEGHKKWKHSKGDYQPTAQNLARQQIQLHNSFPSTDIINTFAPIQTLVNQIRLVNCISGITKQQPELSVLVCANLQPFAHEISELK